MKPTQMTGKKSSQKKLEGPGRATWDLQQKREDKWEDQMPKRVNKEHGPYKNKHTDEWQGHNSESHKYTIFYG